MEVNILLFCKSSCIQVSFFFGKGDITSYLGLPCTWTYAQLRYLLFARLRGSLWVIHRAHTSGPWRVYVLWGRSDRSQRSSFHGIQCNLLQVSGSDDVLKGGRANFEGCLWTTLLKLKSDVSLSAERLKINIPNAVSRATVVWTPPSSTPILASPLFLLLPLP